MSSIASAPDAPTERLYKKGELLFEEGSVGGELFLIKEGTVGIFRKSPSGPGNIAVGRIDPGGVVGEKSLFGTHGRAAAAVALEPVRALVIGEKFLRNVMDSAPPWLTAMLKSMIGRLSDARQRVDRTVLDDREAGLVSLILLLVPRHAKRAGGSILISLRTVMDEAALACRFTEQMTRQCLGLFTKRGLISIESTGEPCLVIPDIDALRYYREYLSLKKRHERFPEAAIPQELVATLSNIAYVAHKSGQETVDGSCLSKSALTEDLSGLYDSAALDRNLAELCRYSLISMVPEENDTTIFFRKEKLTRVKKIQEWLPKFSQEIF